MATGEERQQALEGELTRSISRFDERLAREQGELDEKQAVASRSATERARERLAERASSTGDEPGGDPAFGGMPPPLITSAEGDERGNVLGSPSGAFHPGGGDQADLAHARPDDVGNGRDDNIVARQLREAAEKERDPELRAKLWDEYRDYKRGGR